MARALLHGDGEHPGEALALDVVGGEGDGISFYVSPGANQYGISDLTFSPGVKQTGYVVIPFEASGINNTGRQTYLPGSLYIFVSDGAVQDVTCTVSAGSSQALDREAFLKVYQAASGSKGSGFYIQLLDVPASGVKETLLILP